MTTAARIPTGGELDSMLTTGQPTSPWVNELCAPVFEALAKAGDGIWQCQHADTAPVVLTPLADPGELVVCPDCAEGQFTHSLLDPCDGCGAFTLLASWRVIQAQMPDYMLLILGAFCPKCLARGEALVDTPVGPGEATPE